jgi:hypothetical protein
MAIPPGRPDPRAAPEARSRPAGAGEGARRAGGRGLRGRVRGLALARTGDPTGRLASLRTGLRGREPRSRSRDAGGGPRHRQDRHRITLLDERQFWRLADRRSARASSRTRSPNVAPIPSNRRPFPESTVDSHSKGPGSGRGGTAGATCPSDSATDGARPRPRGRPQASTPARNREPKWRVRTALPSNFPCPGVTSISMWSAVP